MIEKESGARSPTVCSAEYDYHAYKGDVYAI